MTNSDRYWRRWVKAGDIDALGRVFDRTAPELRRLAQYLARDPEAADDAIQNTFLAVLERPRDLGEHGRVEAWLAAILVRQIRRQHQEHARDRLTGSADDALAAAPATGGSPIRQLAGQEFEVRVVALIAELPPGYAEPLRRQLLNGESARSIAEALGLSIGTVHARVSRGLKKLRKLMPASLAAPALGQSAANTPHEAPLRALPELRSRLLKSAAMAQGKTVGLGASGALLPSLVTLACVASVAVIAVGWSLRAAHPEPPASIGELVPTVVAHQDDTARERIDSVLAESVQRIAAGPGLDAVDAPGVDLAALAVPNALIIDENTDRPLAGATCMVTDANGVSVIAETDDGGRLVTDELLLRGQVRVSVMRPKEKRELLLGEPDRFAIDRHQKVGLRHDGNPATPDRWRIGEKRWVPVECASLDPTGTSVELVLATGGPEATFELRWPQPPEQEGLDRSLLGVGDDSTALVFEALQAIGSRRQRRDSSSQTFPPWSRQRVASAEAGRVVRGVQFLEQGALVAEADATVVPYLHQSPIRLEFTPLAESDVDQILALYGPDLGQRMIRHCFPNAAPIDRSRTVTGTVTSESGEYHGPIEVMATNIMLQRWNRGVTWKQEDSGHWIGTFEFTDLPDEQHYLSLSAGPGYRIDPNPAEATPPHEFELGHFIVRDLADEATTR